MSPLNPKAVRLINDANKKLVAKNSSFAMSGKGVSGLTGLLSLLVEIENNDNEDIAPEYKPQKRTGRNTTKGVDRAQSVSGVGMKDIVVLGLLLAGYIFANSIAPVISTEQGTVDPQVSYSRF